MTWANDLVRCQQLLVTVQNSSAGGASVESLQAASELMYRANRMYAGLMNEMKAKNMMPSQPRAASSVRQPSGLSSTSSPSPSL